MSTTPQTPATLSPSRAEARAALRARVRHSMRPWRQATPIARRLVIAGVIITSMFGFMAIFADSIAPYDGDQYRYIVGSTENPDRVDSAGCNNGTFECLQIPRRQEPGGDFPMGTTASRFDVMSRIIHGSRLAMIVVIAATSLSMFIGVPLGLYSGFVGGKIDRLLVMLMDSVYAFPPLILAIIVAFALRDRLEPGVPSAAVSVGVVYIPQYFRVVRNQVLSVKQEVYVEAARSLGAKPRTIITRYVFFNVVSSIPVIFTINAADAVLTLASLGFLGFGVEFPTAEWGVDVFRGLSDATSGYGWTALFPGLAIMVLVLGLTLIGEGLNDIVNPLLRVRGFVGKVKARKLDVSPIGPGDAPTVNEPGAQP
ncbi:MAG: peptide/nickel transport system permease protein [Glaciecola sp.]|jgi:peptide/nickel transport system permease protein